MEEGLTPYQQTKFPSIDNLPMNQWYAINPNREDLPEFKECLKKYQEVWGLLDIDEFNSRFKKIYHPGSVEWAKQNGIEL